MKYFYDRFEGASWQYISDTHSESVKTEILIDIPPATEFRIHTTRFQPGAGAEPHSHEWEHAMYFMAGTGKVVIQGEEAVVKKGMMAFVPRERSLGLEYRQDELVVGVSGPPKTAAARLLRK
jgi:quercetin dioxygenase-like cupin family protein